MAHRYYSRPESEVEPGPVLLGLIQELGRGDVLTVPDVTHLAFTYRALKAIFAALESRGIHLVVRFTSTKRGESDDQRFKADIRRASVARAKASGAYVGNKGRPSVAAPEAVRALRNAGITPDGIATQLGISRASVFRKLASGGV